MLNNVPSKCPNCGVKTAGNFYFKPLEDETAIYPPPNVSNEVIIVKNYKVSIDGYVRVVE